LSIHTSVPAHPTAALPSAVHTRVSSAEYIFTGIRRHKIVAAAVAVTVVLVAGAVWFFGFHRPTPALTDKDTILLADFINTTGDPVFDSTLKQALAAQLRQSPFLDILSEDRVHEALKLMDKSPEERVTPEIAREICERQSIKAMLIGRIAAVGSHYLISLDALNARTGDSLATEQVEAESKEQVLKSLGQGASRLREKLGETLSSVQKFDAPIEQVTTSSLEALRYYSLGLEQHSSGHYAQAIPFYQHAIEVDSRFAIAYARLATCYNLTKQYEAALAASAKAYEYRDRASEREKLFVSWNYYGAVTGQIDEAANALEVWKRTFPRDWEPHNLLAVRYTLTGPFEKAVEEAGEAARLNPKEAKAHANLAIAFMGLNRFDEARQVILNAMAQKMETEAMHLQLYHLAIINSDETAARQEIDWAKAKSSGYAAEIWQGRAAEFRGQPALANQFSEQALERAVHDNAKEAAAQLVAQQAIRAAVFRDCGKVSALTAKVLTFSRDRSFLYQSANALATCGQTPAAQTMIEEMQKRFPQDTLLNSVSIPLIRAQLELNRGNAAQALQLLESARRFDVYGDYWPQYVRGLAYLKQGNGPQAAAEFKTILDHRGWYPVSPLYVLAQLGFARSSALSGDNSAARKAYQDFFASWKDADPALPLITEARQEYDKLK
jgi:eukaryotic-like serine/threonine-protein kinase